MDMGQKLGRGCAPLGEVDLGPQSPSNTMSPRLRPTCIPSGILMNTAIWPQKPTIDMGGKLGACPFLGGGAGSPSI